MNHETPILDAIATTTALAVLAVLAKALIVCLAQ